MELIPLDLKPLSRLYDVLDKFYPQWETRQDDYYLTELAFMILKVFKCSYTDETIINNLRTCKVDKYQNELSKIYEMPLEAYAWICDNRMAKDRAKTSKKRYLKREYLSQQESTIKTEF